MKLFDRKTTTDQPITGEIVSTQVNSGNIRTISIEDGKIQGTAQTPVKVKKRGSWKIKVLAVLLMLASFAGGFYYVKFTQIRSTGLDINIFDPLKNAINIVVPQTESALKSLSKSDGRTNIVLIGVDARSYNESYLTDSIQVLSYDHEKKNIAQISLPRDLNVKAKINPNWNYEGKINAVFPFTYSDEYQKAKNQPAAFVRAFDSLGSAIKQVTGLDIHYGILINFQGFKSVIDTLGGITVNVETSFTDREFPKNDDSGYKLVTFKKGVQTMNGETALDYARSRHGDNGEGSDYMRARRQQIVVRAVQEKINTSNLFAKADTLNQLITTLGNNIRFYKIGSNEIDTGLKARDTLQSASLYSMVLDPEFGGTSGNILTSENVDARGFVVVPRDKTYKQLQEVIGFFFDNPFLLEENAKVAVAWTNAKRAKDYTLSKTVLDASNMSYTVNDFQIKITSVSPTPETSKTPAPTEVKKPGTTTTPPPSSITIYELTGDKKKSIEFYKDLLKKEGNFTASILQKTSLPKELEKAAKDQDILIVIE